jgi:ABC-2 type transport system ATP-binding protein
MLIQVQHVSKAYRGHVVVDDLSFTASPGTTTVLAGPNGAGKSTLFKLMTGIVTGRGHTTFDGMPWQGLRLPRRSVGVYLGSSPFHSNMRVSEHLRLIASTTGNGPKRITTMLEQFDLEAHRRTKIAKLSLGMRQRLGVASAMLADPPALLLDEPFSALDPAESHRVHRWLRGLAGEGRTIIVATHHLALMETYATHALLVADGKLLAAGTTTDIAHAHRLSPRLEVVVNAGAEPLIQALDAHGAQVTAFSERHLRIVGASSEQIKLVSTQAGLSVLSCWESQPSLR